MYNSFVFLAERLTGKTQVLGINQLKNVAFLRQEDFKKLYIHFRIYLISQRKFEIRRNRSINCPSSLLSRSRIEIFKEMQDAYCVYSAISECVCCEYYQYLHTCMFICVCVCVQCVYSHMDETLFLAVCLIFL